jgi:hypothetical protein
MLFNEEKGSSDSYDSDQPYMASSTKHITSAVKQNEIILLEYGVTEGEKPQTSMAMARRDLFPTSNCMTPMPPTQNFFNSQ